MAELKIKQNEQSPGSSEQDLSTPMVTPLKALMILGGVVALVAGFIVLANAFGISSQWVGFLLLFYWSGVERTRIDRLLPCCGGALLGLVMCYALRAFPESLGWLGYPLWLGILLVMIYVLIIGRVSMFVNLMAMLYLTVGSIPAIQDSMQFADLFSGLLLGGLYFGGLAGGAQLMARRRPVSAA